MPLTGWKIAPNWISIAEMDANPNYDLGMFPRQADQEVGRDWMRPDNQSDIVERAAELEDDILGQRYGYGGAKFKWRLRILSPLMVKYFEDTHYGSNFFGHVTTRGYNRATGAWEYYQSTMQYNARESHEAAAGGFDLYVSDFHDATPAPAGPDVTPVKAAVGVFTVGSNASFTISVQNIGDGNTFDDVILTDAIPAGTEFVSVTGTDWTIEYSTNGGSSYSPTVPVPASDVDMVRLTYSEVIAAGEAAPNVQLTVTVLSGGEISNTATVETAGDTDPDNDSDTATTTAVGSGWDTGWDQGFGN